MKKTQIGVILLFMVILLIAFIGMVYGDSGVNATPEVQSITTGTLSNVQGTVTEADSGAWTTTNDPGTNLYEFIRQAGAHEFGLTSTDLDKVQSELDAAGGSIVVEPNNSLPPGNYLIVSLIIPESLLNQPLGYGFTYQGVGTWISGANPTVLTKAAGLHNGVLDPGQVQYTSGYNDQYSGISGQQSFVKSMAISTANKIADQSNIKANTNIQFIAIDEGRATRTEDLLLDGAGNSTDTASAILCPFAQSVSAVIPPYCNIVQAGSAFDTTLTSTVTSADTRFVESDSTLPVVLNYNINAQGITLGNQTSPMIGSASAFLKVHVQEARNSTTQKSEDLVYSETSTASELISKFSKSMSYQSGFNLM